MMQFQNPQQAETLGGRINQARAFTRLTQDQLRRAVGCDRKTLSSWENDHTSPTVHQLLVIAEVTGFSVAWFVDGLVPQRAMAVTERYPTSVIPRGCDGQMVFFKFNEIVANFDAEPDEPAEQPVGHPVSGEGKIVGLENSRR
jgi:transcriptional regulator with XRE-family HTH domain